MLIPLKHWAMSVGINPATARQKAIRGTIPAIKMGRDWFIDSDTLNTDNRIRGKSKRWKDEDRSI